MNGRYYTKYIPISAVFCIKTGIYVSGWMTNLQPGFMIRLTLLLTNNTTKSATLNIAHILSHKFESNGIEKR